MDEKSAFWRLIYGSATSPLGTSPTTMTKFSSHLQRRTLPKSTLRDIKLNFRRQFWCHPMWRRSLDRSQRQKMSNVKSFFCVSELYIPFMNFQLGKMFLVLVCVMNFLLPMILVVHGVLLPYHQYLFVQSHLWCIWGIMQNSNHVMIECSAVNTILLCYNIKGTHNACKNQLCICPIWKTGKTCWKSPSNIITFLPNGASKSRISFNNRSNSTKAICETWVLHPE